LKIDTKCVYFDLNILRFNYNIMPRRNNATNKKRRELALNNKRLQQQKLLEKTQPKVINMKTKCYLDKKALIIDDGTFINDNVLKNVIDRVAITNDAIFSFNISNNCPMPKEPKYVFMNEENESDFMVFSPIQSYIFTHNGEIGFNPGNLKVIPYSKLYDDIEFSKEEFDKIKDDE